MSDTNEVQSGHVVAPEETSETPTVNISLHGYQSLDSATQQLLISIDGVYVPFTLTATDQHGLSPVVRQMFESALAAGNIPQIQVYETYESMGG